MNLALVISTFPPLSGRVLPGPLPGCRSRLREVQDNEGRGTRPVQEIRRCSLIGKVWGNSVDWCYRLYLQGVGAEFVVLVYIVQASTCI